MSKTISPHVQHLWSSWRRNNDRNSANRLIEKYTYLVDYHVDRVASYLPSNVDKEDLISYGLIGLYDALKKYDFTRDIKFDTYASFRIHGAIIDGLRSNDWVPRTLRDKIKKVDQTSSELEQKLQRSPRPKEIAEVLNMPTEEVETILKDSIFTNVLSIDVKVSNNEGEESEGLAFAIPDDTFTLPDDHMLETELKEELIAEIKRLEKNEQLVISLFYKDDLTMTEIGKILNITTSRVSQIHKQAILKLKKSLHGLQTLL